MEIDNLQHGNGNLRRTHSITSLMNMRRVLGSNNNSTVAPSVLHVMVTSYQINNRWDVVERRINRYPEEARYIDEFGNTVLYNVLCRRVNSYPPSSTVRELVRAYPEAVWSGTIENRVGNSPLHAACQRRAPYDILRILK